MAVEFVSLFHYDLHVERQERQNVNDVHKITDKIELIRSKDQSNDELQRKKCCTNVVQIFQYHHCFRHRHCFLGFSRALSGDVDVIVHGGDCLQGETHDGGQHEDEGGDSVYLENKNIL